MKMQVVSICCSTPRQQDDPLGREDREGREVLHNRVFSKYQFVRWNRHVLNDWACIHTRENWKGKRHSESSLLYLQKIVIIIMAIRVCTEECFWWRLAETESICDASPPALPSKAKHRDLSTCYLSFWYSWPTPVFTNRGNAWYLAQPILLHVKKSDR